jgi:hypothetical protein
MHRANRPRKTIPHSNLRSCFARPAYKNKSALGIGDPDRQLPIPGAIARDSGGILGADPEHDMSPVNERFPGPTEELSEFTNRAGYDDIRSDCLRANLLKSLGSDLDVRQSQGSHDLMQKRALLLIGLDQQETKIRTRNFESYAWKPGPAADVGQPTLFHREYFRRKHGFRKMASDNFERLRNGGKTDCTIPFEQHACVDLDPGNLLWG